MKNLFLILLLGLVCAGCAQSDNPVPPGPVASQAGPNADQVLAHAFEHRQSNLVIEGQGTVSRILPDDREGSRHQRFILKLDSGQKLLVAHNIDLAPKVAGLRTGDRIAFKGEYEWNAKGGVIHWTHRDPAGRHAAGWLRHEGQVYQ